MDRSSRVQHSKITHLALSTTAGVSGQIMGRGLVRPATDLLLNLLAAPVSEATCTRCTQSKILPNSRPPVYTPFSTFPPCCEGASLSCLSPADLVTESCNSATSLTALQSLTVFILSVRLRSTIPTATADAMVPQLQ